MITCYSIRCSKTQYAEHAAYLRSLGCTEERLVEAFRTHPGLDAQTERANWLFESS